MNLFRLLSSSSFRTALSFRKIQIPRTYESEEHHSSRTHPLTLTLFFFRESSIWSLRKSQLLSTTRSVRVTLWTWAEFLDVQRGQISNPNTELRNVVSFRGHRRRHYLNFVLIRINATLFRDQTILKRIGISIISDDTCLKSLTWLVHDEIISLMSSSKVRKRSSDAMTLAVMILSGITISLNPFPVNCPRAASAMIRTHFS